MLDKFRSEYIVHFYGAVFIPKKECMVTEFAQFGSLKDLMRRMKDVDIRMKLRVKMMLDCFKGILYLHSNDILHRDIKPDNYLIFSLDINDCVNAKLTDFGSSRNVNMLMTNITFTKGIGTPKYMAPEVLDKKKYKKAADVYSFSLTMLEIAMWKEVFRKDDKDFRFAWNIADFTSSGKRLHIPDTVPMELTSLITSSWTQDPLERANINIVEIGLEKFYNTI
ncbi:serine/threonine protein kinase HT1, putative [Entamoeba invadens IP1]|uniref:Serine/threonine protein kinase HT1, putative n=1 Tax=Entamoeba invadens IP1 TaxID=370355 RepID=A0A0A1UCS3_ENTIV|nr:serine/threonine protein kinase HT1, putative [Entamoeba invadens IP1]ELP93724.1 serine/threonine protein kinase HT1, putative [Entamoeba invadens IP1]|eukprot:XP_004260495.1 serine/threonine protein kinase HT1, putative [Entamoeba invadens IP1]